MEAQLKLAGLIERAYENFGKLGAKLMTMGTCISRMEQLKIRWAEFEAAHKRLEEDSDVGPDDPYFKEDKYDKTYEAFLMNLGLFQDRLLEVKAETLRLGTQPAADGIVNDMDVNRTKLPAIVIGDFSGDIQDWVRFRDTFREMVIERPNRPNIFKMNYLRSYVKGEAAELLQEVPSGGDHFATAWQVLLSHYDNKRLLINKLMTKLMSLPAMANDSATELMRVLNGVRNLLQALKALGSPIDQWDHFTVFLTRSKISPKCQSKWEDSVKQSGDPTEPDTFRDLCKFLEAERKAASWHYINTKQNPADVASRGCNVACLSSDRLWWNGPEMLSATIRPWAKEEVDYAQEVPAEDATVEKTAFVQNTIPLQDCELFNRFSSYTRLRKVMVYCLRFVTKLARQCHLTLTLQFTPDVGPEITVAELEQSAHHLCRMTQAALLGEEIKRISNQAELQKGHTP
ncbi:unnamed protein product [Trichogramma brassicae]|uniref:Uncharacterized protein n=1 Tax=Trichogramma brassicae TaxID=86971 RepID=A0A6H5IU30_9HYME|nr:unnamed protein product [Trichogramma brassicae]